MKKILGFLTLAALVSPIANASKCGPGKFTGWYAGANLHAGSVTGKSISPHLDNPRHFGRSAFGGGLFAGYGLGFSKLGYAAVEVFGDLSSAKFGAADGETQASGSVKRPYGVGGALLLGVATSQMSSTILYARLGFEYSKWKFTRATEQVSANRELVSSFNNNCLGVAPGLGVRTSLGESKWFVDANYSYSVGGKIKKDGVTYVKSTVNQKFQVGVGYKF